VITDSDIENTQKISLSRWNCPAIYFMHLVHPSRWNHEGVHIETENATEHGPSPPFEPSKLSAANGTDMDIKKEAAHVFRDTEVDWGYCHFVQPNMLRPGAYCDDEFNLVIKVRIQLHRDGNGNGIGNKKMKMTREVKPDVAGVEGVIHDVKKLDVNADAEETAGVLAAFIVNYEQDVISTKLYRSMRDKLSHTFKKNGFDRVLDETILPKGPRCKLNQAQICANRIASGNS